MKLTNRPVQPSEIPVLLAGNYMGLNEEVDTQGTNDFQHSVKAWFCAWTECLVQTFPSQPTLGGDLRHSPCASDMAKCPNYF